MTGPISAEYPLVTIGCAVYNGEATLERALAAVVAQDYPHLEILISDDCSTDGSFAICEEFARRDPRIRLLRNPKNIGLSKNNNLLVTEAQGTYFMWADQDDFKAPSFVSKTAAALEVNPEAVLCHSHTGVFHGDPDEVSYIITLYGVDGERSLVCRYLKFLRYFSDSTIYGLIRTSALRKTSLYGSDVGAANSLLFELLLQGMFVQVPEVLYFYSARGMKKRPDVRAEYARANGGKLPPRFYLPFLVVAINETKDILRSSLELSEKVEVASVLWAHTSAVAATKLVYRALAAPLGEVARPLADLCDRIVESRANVEIPEGTDRAELFPKYWTLRGGR